MGLYWTLFKTFFKIGVVTFGGGYAMIPMIEEEVVHKNQWINKDRFVDLLAIAQSCPGAFAVNISIFIGYAYVSRRVELLPLWDVHFLLLSSFYSLPCSFISLKTTVLWQQYSEASVLQ